MKVVGSPAHSIHVESHKDEPGVGSSLWSAEMNIPATARLECMSGRP